MVFRFEPPSPTLWKFQFSFIYFPLKILAFDTPSLSLTGKWYNQAVDKFLLRCMAGKHSFNSVRVTENKS